MNKYLVQVFVKYVVNGDFYLLEKREVKADNADAAYQKVMDDCENSEHVRGFWIVDVDTVK